MCSYLNFDYLFPFRRFPTQMQKKSSYYTKFTKGIPLEDPEFFLEWDTDYRYLQHKLNPQDQEDKGISLKRAISFAGRDYDVWISEEHCHDKLLESVSFDSRELSPKKIYQELFDHFTQEIGPPSEEKEDKYGYPTGVWQLKGSTIVIAIGERFMDYLIFNINKRVPHIESFERSVYRSPLLKKGVGILIMISSLLWGYNYVNLLYLYSFTDILFYFMYPYWVLGVFILFALWRTRIGYHLFKDKISIRRALFWVISFYVFEMAIDFLFVQLF